MWEWMAGAFFSLSGTWPGYLILGLFIGLLTGLFGVGGGFLMTPCLRALFGLPFPLAVGSSLGAIFCTGMVSVFRHHRHGNVAYRLGICMTAGALFGTLIGKMLMSYVQRLGAHGASAVSIPDLLLNSLFLLLLVAVVWVVTWESRRPGKKDHPETASAFARRLHRIAGGPRISIPRSAAGESINVWIPVVMSFFVGILTGLLGVGGGFVMFPILVFGLGIPTVVAVGTGAFQLVFASGLGTVLYARMGLVSFTTVAMLVGGSLIGAEVGVRLAMRLHARRLKGYFNLVVMAGIGVVLYDLWRILRGA